MRRKSLIAILIVSISIVTVGAILTLHDQVGTPLIKLNKTAGKDSEYPLKEINKGNWSRLTNLTTFIHSLKHASEREHTLPYLQPQQ